VTLLLYKRLAACSAPPRHDSRCQFTENIGERNQDNSRNDEYTGIEASICAFFFVDFSDSHPRLIQ
jgi:hypothetical protein